MDPVVQLALIAIVLTIVFRLLYTLRKVRRKGRNGNDIQRKLEELRKKRDEE